MQVSIILGHPRPGSFNHAIAEAAQAELIANGHEVSFHDLHAEGFDPVLQPCELDSRGPIPALMAPYCDEVAKADGLVIVHPNWWGQPPVILKGWVDRVLRAGVAYRFLEGDAGEGIPIGLLRAKAALVFNTSNTPHQREQEVFGDPLEALWKRCIFEFCGVKQVDRRMFGVIVTSTPEVRRRWLDEVRALVAARFPRGG